MPNASPAGEGALLALRRRIAETDHSRSLRPCVSREFPCSLLANHSWPHPSPGWRDAGLQIGIASVCLELSPMNCHAFTSACHPSAVKSQGAYPPGNPLPRYAASNHRAYAARHGYRDSATLACNTLALTAKGQRHVGNSPEASSPKTPASTLEDSRSKSSQPRTH